MRKCYVTLVESSSNQNRHRHEIDPQGLFIIGSDTSSNLQLSAEPALQQRHVILYLANEAVVLRVAGADPAGIVLKNDAPVEAECQLWDGDEVTIGAHTRLRISFEHWKAGHQERKDHAFESRRCETPGCKRWRYLPHGLGLTKIPLLCDRCTEGRLQQRSIVGRISNFQLIQPIYVGKTTYTTVYEAIDAHTGYHAAIKCDGHIHGRVNAESVGRSIRFVRREQRVVQILHHPNIVHHFEVGFWRDHDPALQPPDIEIPYIAMELVRGGSLQRLVLNHSGRVPIPHILAYAADLFRGLEYVHFMGLIHRDIRPSNILLSGSESTGWTAKLADFGLVRTLNTRGLTDPNTFLGTPSYVSPEQVDNPRAVYRSADIYSAAAVVYFLFSGKPPLLVHQAEVDEDIGKLSSRIQYEQRRPLLDMCFPSYRPFLLASGLSKYIDGLVTPDGKVRTANSARVVEGVLRKYLDMHDSV